MSSSLPSFDRNKKFNRIFYLLPFLKMLLPAESALVGLPRLVLYVKACLSIAFRLICILHLFDNFEGFDANGADSLE